MSFHVEITLAYPPFLDRPEMSHLRGCYNAAVSFFFEAPLAYGFQPSRIIGLEGPTRPLLLYPPLSTVWIGAAALYGFIHPCYGAAPLLYKTIITVLNSLREYCYSSFPDRMAERFPSYLAPLVKFLTVDWVWGLLWCIWPFASLAAATYSFLDWCMGKFHVAVVGSIIVAPVVLFISFVFFLTSVWVVFYLRICQAMVYARNESCILSLPAAKNLHQALERQELATAAHHAAQALLLSGATTWTTFSPLEVDMFFDVLRNPSNWLALLKNRGFTTVKNAARARALSKFPATGNKSAEQDAWAVVADLLDHEVETQGYFRPTTPTFSHAAQAVADILLDFIRQPFLPHLRRPISLPAFYPFFIPWPLLSRALDLVRIWLAMVLSTYFNVCLISSEYSFGDATFQSFRAQLQAFVQHVSQDERYRRVASTVLRNYLSELRAEAVAVQAEEKAHEAILDAVLVWKARKEDEARASRRLKAE